MSCTNCFYNLNVNPFRKNEMYHKMYQIISKNCEECNYLKLCFPTENKENIVTKNCCEFPKLEEHDYLICVNCGKIKDKFICTDKEYQNYKKSNGESNNDKTRCTSSTNDLQEYNLGTIIKNGNLKLMKNHNKSKNNIQTHRQKVIQDTFNMYSNTANSSVEKIIVNLAVEIFVNICNIKKDSKRKEKLNIFKGKRRIGMQAVCLWLAYKQNNTDKSPEDISKMFNISEKCFYKELLRYEVISKEKVSQTKNENSFDNLIRNYSNSLGIPFKIGTLIIEICKTTFELKIIENIKPKTLICTVIYFVLLELGGNSNEMSHENFNLDGDLSTLLCISEIPEKLRITFGTLKKNVVFLFDKKQMIYSVTQKRLINEIFKKSKF